YPLFWVGAHDDSPLRDDRQPRAFQLAVFEQIALVLVATQLEMSRRGKHALDGRELFRHEARYFLQRSALNEKQQIVAPRHQVAGLDFVEAADSLRQSVEPTAAFRRDAHLDNRPHS